ncbi:nicotinamide riboside transporter PnuC [Raineya orbicola]|jgi:nicotinamide mononucleotide transporter|uniref:Nicotinamide riboside transporter PnuC n=1 Tax=Raineya orbicola TaxID=2016530 RepID=A0A2N3I9P0_9BACT|nr:nicotinamide riboside transporter PnuC [Raineya orbicola]PKQ67052.1 Nicotinamide mononucleotide transporter PnuC [Raineya orbicola]
MKIILDWLKDNYLEILGFLTSLYCVWLNIKANLWAWFWAVVSSAISAVFFYQLRLYGDMNLQFFFIATSIYGFWQWKFGKRGLQRENLTIVFLPKHLYKWVLLAFLIIFALTYQALAWLKGDILLWDTLTTTLSILATWLLARKYVENWLVWIVADFIYVGMYWHKTAYLYALLYAIFLGMASKGFWEWRKDAVSN